MPRIWEDMYKLLKKEPFLTIKKNHRLLGNNVLDINSTKLINEIKMEKNVKLKNNKASLKLKENVSPVYYEA